LSGATIVILESPYMLDTSKKNVKKKVQNSKTNVNRIFEKEEMRLGILENKPPQEEQEILFQKIREEVLQKFKEYKTTLNYMAADAPIEILCLPKVIETCLLDHGYLRIYDLFDVDLTKVKGLGVSRIRHLTACLDKFFSMF
jgi:hypothetical protein